MPFDMDLARAPGRARLTTRKKGSGCENGTMRNFWEIESTGTDKNPLERSRARCKQWMRDTKLVYLGEVIDPS